VTEPSGTEVAPGAGPGAFVRHGEVLVPGRNVDRVDVAAGLAQASAFGYGGTEHQMVVEYALMRHRRGEEDGAQRTALSGGISLTDWYAILAAGLAAAGAKVRAG
jgi:hypothetical protein